MTNESEKGIKSKLTKHIRTRLVSGLLVLIPLAITIFIIRLIFNTLTSFATPILRPWIGTWPEYILLTIAFITTVILLYAVGLIATHIVGKRLIRIGEAILLKLPIVKTVYSASKQVVDTFSLSNAASFKAVALIEFPHQKSLAIGFITGTMLNESNKKLYRVFVPTTPNPTSGFLLILPEKEVHFTDISVEDGVKMVVSGGMLSPVSYKEISNTLE